MSDEPPFHDLIGRVRRGDEQAAAELVRRYGPAIRRAVRSWLTDPRLQRTCDSMDICQSVLGSFFVGAVNGRYDLHTPQQLVGLLMAMARNKLLKQVRHQRAARRDNRRLASEVNHHDLADRAPGPARQVEAKDLLKNVCAKVREHLPPSQQRVVELRMEGLTWGEIGFMLGRNPNRLCERFNDVVRLVKRQLGLENDDE